MQLSSVRELKDLFTQTILAADSAPNLSNGKDTPGIVLASRTRSLTC
jgi:hypothetical protein